MMIALCTRFIRKRLLGLIAIVLALALGSARGASAVCQGDCNLDTEVTIDDLLTMVSIAQGTAQITACSAGNANADEEITIDEILTAVNNALTGCPAETTPTATEPLPSNTATPTATPSGAPIDTATSTPSDTPTSGPTPTPTPTQPMPTPGVEVPPLAARAAIAAKALSVAPIVVSAVANGLNFSAALTFDPAAGGGAGACPEGGTATRVGTFPIPPNIAITLNRCKVRTRDGFVTFDGTASVGGNFLNITFNGDVTARFEDASGTPTLTAQAMLSGTVVGLPNTGGNCQLRSLTLRVSSGFLSATTPQGQTSRVNFQNTTMAIDNITYSSSCVPLMYRLTFMGAAALLTPGGQPEGVTFNNPNLTVDVDDSGSTTLLSFSGGMTSSCFGGTVGLSTITQLSVPSGEICPTGGVLAVTLPQGMARVTYGADTSVDLDLDGDGVTDLTAPNCLDPRLLMCLA